MLKLTILSFDDENKVQAMIPKDIYMAMFNPASYKIENKFEYNDAQPANNGEAPPPPFKGIAPKSYSFDFVIDGTGAAGAKRMVLLDVYQFMKVVGVDKNMTNTAPGGTGAGGGLAAAATAAVGGGGASGASTTTPVPGRTRYLILIWGSMILHAVAETVSINYTLFDSAGIPLRATISATFKESDKKSKLESLIDDVMSNSVVSSVLSVAALSQQVLGSPGFGPDIARSNNLNSLRAPIDGLSLTIPQVK